MSKKFLNVLTKESNKLGKLSSLAAKNYKDKDNDITDDDAISIEDQIGVVLAAVRLISEEFGLKQDAIMESAEVSYNKIRP
jgi:hypothetical protein